MTAQDQASITQPLTGEASDLPHGDQESVAQHVRRYLYVFYALLFGTLITLGASYIPFGNHAINIAVALVIACGKASLVAGFFMHLISERKLIYGLLAFTANAVRFLTRAGTRRPVVRRRPLARSRNNYRLPRRRGHAHTGLPEMYGSLGVGQASRLSLLTRVPAPATA